MQLSIFVGILLEFGLRAALFLNNYYSSICSNFSEMFMYIKKTKLSKSIWRSRGIHQRISKNVNTYYVFIDLYFECRCRRLEPLLY